MLEPILLSTRRRLESVKRQAIELERRAAERTHPADFAAALEGRGLSVIAEIKRRSPSAGAIAPDLDRVALAGRYEQGGAAAISVLTEPDHFGGSLHDLEVVEAGVAIPVLRKDFVLDRIQVTEALAHGAAAILLIVAILDQPHLTDLVECVNEAGMAALVEAHDADEVGRALDAGARIIGVNNRDLTTFDVDLATAERLRSHIPDGVVCVAESGVHGPDDAHRMAAAGYDAVLVGQAAAESADPAAFVASLREPAA